ncbi:MAG: hypothetical protein PHR77_22555 [Kiritimatiellae bacterium]|nr:hypothetical protein [Kiritimatiellia bacterium]MDD5520539.1 hypothetical protein [Kiritimatiellia bacterium]
MSRKLTILADEGEASSTDDGCAVLYGIVRDCAYKIRGRAERERDVHKVLGVWDELETSSGRDVSNSTKIQT